MRSLFSFLLALTMCFVADVGYSSNVISKTDVTLFDLVQTNDAVTAVSVSPKNIAISYQEVTDIRLCSSLKNSYNYTIESFTNETENQATIDTGYEQTDQTIERCNQWDNIKN